jgi:hypothetical protein
MNGYLKFSQTLYWNISQAESQWINFDSLINHKTIADTDKLGINFLLHY